MKKAKNEQTIKKRRRAHRISPVSQCKHTARNGAISYKLKKRTPARSEFRPDLQQLTDSYDARGEANSYILKNVLIFIVLPFIINIVLESLGSEDILGGFKRLIDSPYVFFSNTLIIAATISIGIFSKRFRIFWVFAISVCWLILGTVNCILLTNRVLPFTVYDLQLLDSLPYIIRKYLAPVPLAILCICIVITLLGFFALFFRALSAPKEKINFKKSAIFFAIIISLTLGNLKFATAFGALETRFPELAKAYTDNGFAYSFILGLVDQGVQKVDGYSEELIDSITDSFELSDESDVKTPNIIFLQLESFFDLNTLKYVEFSENPIPNFTRLCADNPSGLLTVPVIGAGTVNTEFEIVTGMRAADFGAAEYPYKTVLENNTCESIANNVKNYGYTSHFIHNYKGTFYGRNNVYANLGYDRFYSIEYMSGYNTTESGWAKDAILLRYINESLDSTEGSDLVTAVSVQAHGSYSNKTEYTRHITVTACENKKLHSSYEYYVNQIHEMDRFLCALVMSLVERQEETVLVVYGDHLPSLELKEEDLTNRNIYQTDYFIWNNMGIEYDDEDLHAYQLNSKVLESLNITDGVINSCHREYRDDERYLFNLQALEYDMLYGEKYAFDTKEPYTVSNMRINVPAFNTQKVSKKSDDEN